jgi:hypothetical protein
MAVENRPGGVRPYPAGPQLPLAPGEAVMAADTSEETPVSMKTVAVPEATRHRLWLIRTRLLKEEGPYAYWQIINRALDAAGFEK